jgi:hypothetical protein
MPHRFFHTSRRISLEDQPVTSPFDQLTALAYNVARRPVFLRVRRNDNCIGFRRMVSEDGVLRDDPSRQFYTAWLPG